MPPPNDRFTPAEMRAYVGDHDSDVNSIWGRMILAGAKAREELDAILDAYENRGGGWLESCGNLGDLLDAALARREAERKTAHAPLHS